MNHFKIIINQIWPNNSWKNLHCKNFLQRLFKFHKGNHLACLDIHYPHAAVAFSVLLGDGNAAEHKGLQPLAELRQ